MTQVFDKATFLWTAVIAYNIKQVLMYDKGREVEGYMVRYSVFVWGTSAFLSTVVAVADGYGVLRSHL